MTNATWRKRFSVWRNRLYLYPAPDFDAAHTGVLDCDRSGSLAGMSLRRLFYRLSDQSPGSVFDARRKPRHHDQAIWTTLHGNMLHMTICNVVGDTNCYSLNGIPRFAIHFEPVLFVVSLFYIPWPNPDTLLVLQSIVVATGAFPAFWLARLVCATNGPAWVLPRSTCSIPRSSLPRSMILTP